MRPIWVWHPWPLHIGVHLTPHGRVPSMLLWCFWIQLLFPLFFFIIIILFHFFIIKLNWCFFFGGGGSVISWRFLRGDINIKRKESNCISSNTTGVIVAKWLRCHTQNPEVMGSSPALTTKLELFLGRPQFNSLVTLVNSQLVCWSAPCQLGF